MSSFVLRVVALVLSIVSVALLLLNGLSQQSALMLIGISVACLALDGFRMSGRSRRKK